MSTENTALDAAIQRVLGSPDNRYEDCLAFADQWLARRRGSLAHAGFTSGEVRRAASKIGIEPREPRVWGAVFRTLSTEGRIFRVSYTNLYRSHGGLAAVWVKG